MITTFVARLCTQVAGQQVHLFGDVVVQVQVLGITWTTTVKVTAQWQAEAAVLDISQCAR